MASYIIRKIDDELWHQVKTKALQERNTVKAVIERLLREWVQPHNVKAIKARQQP